MPEESFEMPEENNDAKDDKKRKKGFLGGLKDSLLGSSNDEDNNTSDLYPDKQFLLNTVFVKAQRLFDIFRFVLMYKKRAASGLQFYGMRKYTPQDDASKIDWKTSVRMSAGHDNVDELYLKEYEEELDLHTFILLDTSNSMLFGSQKQLKSDLAATVSATLCYAASVAKTRFGMAMFNDDVARIHMPKRGDVQFHRILDSICYAKYYKGGCDIGRAIKVSMQSLPRRSLFVVISDFIDMKPGWEKPLKQAGSMFDAMIGIMVRDTLDRRIPEGIGNARLSPPFDTDASEVDLDKIRKRYNEEAKKEEENLKKLFNNAGAGFITIDTSNDDFIKPLIEYFSLWASGH